MLVLSFFTKFVLVAIPPWKLSHIGSQCSGYVLLVYVWCTFIFFRGMEIIQCGESSKNFTITPLHQLCHLWLDVDFPFLFGYCNSQKKDAGACNNVGHACNNVPPDTMHSFRKTWRYYKSQEKRMNKDIHIIECRHWILWLRLVHQEPILSWS